MSASQIRFGAAATKFRSSRFGAIGRSWRLSGVRTRRGRAVMAHQSLEATAAPPAVLRLQFDMDARAAVASVGIAMDPLDVVNEVTIGGGAPALRARAPGIIAGRRDPEHVAQDRRRVVGAAIFDEAESHVRTPAKIAIDFFK